MVVSVAVHLCAVLVANASTVMRMNEIPRQNGNSFSCLAIRIPEHLYFTRLGKSFILSKQSPCLREFSLRIFMMFNMQC